MDIDYAAEYMNVVDDNPIEGPAHSGGNVDRNPAPQVIFQRLVEDRDEGADDSGDDEALLQERIRAHELEQSWEPPRRRASTVPPDAQANPIRYPSPTVEEVPVEDEPPFPSFQENRAGRENEQDETNGGDQDQAQQRLNVDARADRHPQVLRYSEHHRSSRAGHPVQQRGPNAPSGPLDNVYSSNVGSSDNPWAPFRSKLDWEVAKWAKMRGAGSNAFTELLAIDGICESLGLSYTNSEQLNKIVDKLPCRPKFKRREIVVDGESFEIYSRDIIECLKALFGDPEFLPYLVFEPERHYADEDKTVRMVHDMHTGKWWWDTQKNVEKETKKKGITVVPVILSSDKTQLTVFGSKMAYPVYLTIGNLPKGIRCKPSRQAQILLAYLPTSKLKHIKSKAARRRTLANLFHFCLAFLTEPLIPLATSGILMTTGDGSVYDCHPIFAVYAGDYQEQTLVTCVKYGDCPECPTPRDKMGDPNYAGRPRDIAPILEALKKVEDGSAIFNAACKAAGIKPIQGPFWEKLPFVNIFQSVTPDILHQLYQGNLKHLVGWVIEAYGSEEIDARCRRIPPNHNIRLFFNGVSHLSHVTGKEHDQISRFLLGILIDIPIPQGSPPRTRTRLLLAARSLLDFLNLAKYPVHTDETLGLLAEALATYQENRHVFIDLGIREDFNFPKDHMLNHYVGLIKRFGTADNYNTEMTERLHIDLAKDAYRSTNRKDEYPQMTAWLDHRERILLHEKYLRRRRRLAEDHIPGEEQQAPPIPPPRQIPLVYLRHLHMASRPSARGVLIDSLWRSYSAQHFRAALSRYVVHLQHPELSLPDVKRRAETLFFPIIKISIFHRLKFLATDPFSRSPNTYETVDSIHCDPHHFDRENNVVLPGRFDTALVNLGQGRRAGVHGYSVCRVRFIFTIPAAALKSWFPGKDTSCYPVHLAYVEWFNPFPPVVAGAHRMYKITPAFAPDGSRKSSVVPVHNIRQSIHLIPSMGPAAPPEWTSSNVLDLAAEFYVNPFSDRFQYSTIY